MGGKEESDRYSSLWLAPNPSKRWGELFFLLYTPFWLTLCLGIVVPFKLYESFTELEYLLIGLVSAVPAFLLPMLFVGKADIRLAWKDRYWVKASVWIIIFSYVGNYFWTHYFFTVLGASYTFPSWKITILRHFTAGWPEQVQWVAEAAWILALSYFIAYLETVAIANFPYYQFVDRASMYTVGSLFYAIYFIVSFPMFLRIDEKPGDPWDLPCLERLSMLWALQAGHHNIRPMAHRSGTHCPNSRNKTVSSTWTAMVPGTRCPNLTAPCANRELDELVPGAERYQAPGFMQQLLQWLLYHIWMSVTFILLYLGNLFKRYFD